MKNSRKLFEKLRTIQRAFSFYGVAIARVAYNGEEKYFEVCNRVGYKITRNEMNSFLRKYREAKRAYVNQQISLRG